MHRRIGVAERPFISRQLPVRVHVPFPQDQQQLPLGEGRVDQREGDGMKRQIPGREPRVFPPVRHRDDVTVHHVLPVIVAHAAGRRLRLRRVAGQPPAHVEQIGLLGPQHPRQRLPLDQTSIGVGDLLLQRLVELVRISPALVDPVRVIQEGWALPLDRPESQPRHRARAGGQLVGQMGRALGPALTGIDGAAIAPHHAIVDPVLERTRRFLAPQPAHIGLVGAEQPLARRVLDLELHVPQARMMRMHRPIHELQQRPVLAIRPGPGIARP